jgi:hypothetical protein
MVWHVKPLAGEIYTPASDIGPHVEYFLGGHECALYLASDVRTCSVECSEWMEGMCGCL